MAYLCGYPVVYDPKHHRALCNGYVYEHIIVAESKLNRKLCDSEVVHHIDEHKDNNSPENLMVFKTAGDHSRFHKTGICTPLEDGAYISPSPQYGEAHIDKCPLCGNLKEKRAKLCVACYKMLKSMKSRKPPEDVLIDLLKSKNKSEIGRLFGVSEAAVRKWIKSYQL